MNMEVMQILHMNEGGGEISYAKNSTVQRKTLSISTPIIEEAVVELLASNVMGIESMGIADLGCSSGPNTLLLISQIIDVILACKLGKVAELRVLLNDLFSNDFNSIFKSLPSLYNKLKKDYCNCRDPDQRVIHPLISAVPGSFYGPLFPRKSMHFVHSSFSLHWLSQVPDGLNNKGMIYISKRSPQCVVDAYSMQFQKDFSVFLRSRAQEMVDGGRMVLSFMGRPSSDPTADQGTFYQFELLAHALMAMVFKGLIKEEKLDSFNMPYYTSCVEELNLVLQNEGSFIKDRIEAFEVDWDTSGDDLDHNMPNNAYGDDQTITSSGLRVAKSIRVVTESMLESHFRKEIMDDVFQKYAELVSRRFSDPTADQSTYHLELLAQALIAMVSNGGYRGGEGWHLQHALLCLMCRGIEFGATKRRSFIKDCIETFEVDWDSSEAYLDQNMTSNSGFGDDQTIIISG